MKHELVFDFPLWVDDKEIDYSLCLSNDIDSLLSCIYLKRIKGYNISHFYDFSNAYEAYNSNNVIGVDIALHKGKTWDNHVTMLNKTDYYNKDSANINNILGINRENYFTKYCGSTLLEILSYYDIDISNYSDEAKMILLAIDSTYKGYYSAYSNDNKANKYYLCEVLKFKDLYNILENHKITDFLKIINKYGLSKNIYIENGILETEIDLAALSKVFLFDIKLPEDKFIKAKDFSNLSKKLPAGDYSYYKTEDSNIFSMAITGQNYVSYSKSN